MIVKTIIRMDSEGSGMFGASRGSRVHRGVDYVAHPGQIILSPVTGKITKIGYPYANDLSFRYVEVTDRINKLKHRIFYILPFEAASIGDTVSKGEELGTVDDIRRRYNQKMIPHIHYEIIAPDGTYLNPEELFRNLS